MATLNEIREELNDSVMLKFLSSAFTEASAARIKKIRDSFEKNREFYQEVSYLYHLVTNSNIIAKAKKGGKNSPQIVPPSPDKKAMVAVTSNQHFYGSINSNIIRQFASDVESKKDFDIIVIGKTGKDLMRSKRTGRPCEYIQFAKDNPDDNEVRNFLAKTSSYGSIQVYFPKFVTLVTQKVDTLDIAVFAKPDDKIKEEEVNIIFEPELSKMIEFFRIQIQAILFLRVILETDLSRTAARMISMSASEERATDLIKEKKLELRKAQVAIMNRKMLETFAGMSKWK